MRIAFSEFVVDRATRQLFRGGTEVHLEPKAFELLELLLTHRPEAVSKTEIQRRLWPDTFVSESSLTGLVAQVRRALADDRRQERFLRTVHGFGYAFSGEIATSPEREPGLAARLIWEDSEFVLKPGDYLLGRSEDASVRIDAPGVSRRHARIVVTEDRATIEDLTSKNGTFLCERRLDGPTPLRDGDRLRLGRQLLVFRSAGVAASTRTDSPPPVRSA
ncbi:MAG TPA: FHA domain-containing protein [Vicinamibacteria bacterium]|jgi:DNA-binding winged helix-turn-helix (wHTH) protein|nr:FHA domain-containing protein [Vicinamibacteria bacterium]